MTVRTIRYWAFLAHPEQYRIEAAVAERTVDTWTSKRSDVRAGDQCVIWKAQGHDGHRGIVAFGDVLSDPKLLDDSTNPYWTPGQAPRTRELRIRVRYRRPPRLPLWLGANPGSVLSELSVSRGQGTVFTIEPAQWERLSAMAGDSATERVGRNPAWTRDELILALDLYLRSGQLDDTHAEVIVLSQILNALPIHTTRPDLHRFRNANGVAMKLGNFSRFDPAYRGVGLTRGSHLEGEVWDYFIGRRDELARVATALRSGAVSASFPTIPAAEEDEAEGPEGRLLSRRHLVRERAPKLRAKKQAMSRQKSGILACEVCGFNFEGVYGAIGKDFIECHHLKALSATGETVTRLSDLALVCSNCHRMLHREKPWPNLAELRSRIHS